MRKLLIKTLILTFFFTTLGPLPDLQAQGVLNLPEPGRLIFSSQSFRPLELKGIQIYHNNPLRFDFLVDKGDSGLYGQELKDEITRLTKYFLTCLTVPEGDLWVNLSPFEKDRIAPEGFGVTEMGKSLLEQDYLLKQIMASMSHPQSDLGAQFWKKVYQKSQEIYGTTQLPVQAFNKVWIVPQSAKVYVKGNGAFVIDGKLDVKLEADFVALSHQRDRAESRATARGVAQLSEQADRAESRATARDKSTLKQHEPQAASEYTGAYSQVIKEIILPELRREVNEGKHFATVRQVYHAMILAVWYKRHLKDSLLGKAYVGQNKVAGIDVDDKTIKEKIFQQYLQAYKKCVYNYIKEDYDPLTQTMVARKYVSGGMDFALFGLHADRVYQETPHPDGMMLGNDLAMATVDMAATASDGRVLRFPDRRTYQNTHPFNQWRKENLQEPADKASLSKTIKSYLPKMVLGVMLALSGVGLRPIQAQDIDLNKLPLEQRIVERQKLIDGLKAQLSEIEKQIEEKKSQGFEMPRTNAPINTNAISPTASQTNNESLTKAPVLTVSPTNDVLEKPVGTPMPIDKDSIEPEKSTISWAWAAALSAAAGFMSIFINKIFFGSKEIKKDKQKDLPSSMRVRIEPRNGPPKTTQEEEQVNRGLKEQMDQLVQEEFVMPEYPGEAIKHSSTAGGMLSVVRWLTVGASMWMAGMMDGVNAIDMFFIGSIMSALLSGAKDKFFCGIIGIGRSGTVAQLSSGGDKNTLGWFQVMMRRLGFRGEHSAGLLAMVPDKNGKVQVVIEKDMKTKHGPSKNLITRLFSNFKSKLPPLDPNTPHQGYMLRLFLGHTRWATGGRVTINATHPHLGPLLSMNTWKYNFEGQLVRDTAPASVSVGFFNENKKESNVVTAGIGHNGDNDAYRFFEKDRHITDLDELRGLFSALTFFKGKLPPGDSPPIPLEILYHLTQGNWFSCVRFAHTEVHHHSVDEVKADILTMDELGQAGYFFDQHFGRFAHILSRPGLKQQEKSLRDAFNESQLGLINQFKEYLKGEIKKAVAKGDLPERLYRHWSGSQGQKVLDRFIDLAVERFYIGDRFTAAQEFKDRSSGTYGLFIQDTGDLNGFCLVSRKQGVVFGYDRTTREIAFASDPFAIQEQSPDGRRLENLIYLNPAGEGEILNVHLSRHSGDLVLGLYSVDQKRFLGPDEIKSRHQRLSPENPYWKALPKATSILEDVKDIPKGIFEARNSYQDPQSFNFKSAEEMLKRLLSLWIERQMLSHIAYSRIQPMVVDRARHVSEQCLDAREGCNDDQKKMLLQEATAQREKDSIIMRMIRKRILLQARVLANALVAGDIAEAELNEQYPRVISSQASHVIRGLNVPTLGLLAQDWYSEKDLPSPQEEEKGESVDFIIAGYEKSEMIAKVMEELMMALFPGLKTKAVHSNDLLDYENESLYLQRARLALVEGDFGSNFADLEGASIMAHAIGANNVFGMTSRIDSTLSIVLGQSLNEEEEFTNRIFVTGDLRQNQAATYSEAVTIANNVCLAFHLAKRLRALLPSDRPFGLSMSDKDLTMLESFQDSMFEDAKRTTGVDQTGHPLQSEVTQRVHPRTQREFKADVHQQLVAQAKMMSKRFLEVPIVNAVFWTYVVGVCSLWGGIVGHLISYKAVPISALEGALTLSLGGFIIPALYRVVTRWFFWDRFGPPANISYAGRKGFHEMQELFYGTIFSLASKSTGAQPHSADIKRNVVSKLARLMTRGSIVCAHLPSARRMLGITKSGIGQLKVTRSSILGVFKRFLSGAHSLTTSRRVYNDPQKNVSDFNVVIGGEGFVPDQDDPAISPSLRMVFDRVIDPFGGYIADKVRWAYVARYAGIGRSLGTLGGAAADTTQSPVPPPEKLPYLNRDNALRSDARIVSPPKEKGGVDMHSHWMEMDVKGRLEEVYLADIEEFEKVAFSGLRPEVFQIRNITALTVETSILGSP